MGYGLVKVTGRDVSLLDLGVLKRGKVKDGHKNLQPIGTDGSRVTTTSRAT